MTAQGAKLMDVLTIAVHSLARLDKVVPALRMLGRRHAAEYGVRDADYDTVGAALLWTLERGLGSFFTADVRDAWETTYGTLAGVMRAAGAEAMPLASVAAPAAAAAALPA
jgi:hemoglobin-like flavoprotein